jgi:hypothetical protein
MQSCGFEYSSRRCTAVSSIVACSGGTCGACTQRHLCAVNAGLVLCRQIYKIYKTDLQDRSTRSSRWHFLHASSPLCLHTYPPKNRLILPQRRQGTKRKEEEAPGADPDDAASSDLRHHWFYCTCLHVLCSQLHCIRIAMQGHLIPHPALLKALAFLWLPHPTITTRQPPATTHTW